MEKELVGLEAQTKTSKTISPLKAIKEKCLDCCCGDAYEVKKCTAEKCPLFVYRFGKGAPRNCTEEVRKAAGERIKKYRRNKKDDV